MSTRKWFKVDVYGLLHLSEFPPTHAEDSAEQVSLPARLGRHRDLKSIDDLQERGREIVSSYMT